MNLKFNLNEINYNILLLTKSTLIIFKLKIFYKENNYYGLNTLKNKNCNKLLHYCNDYSKLLSNDYPVTKITVITVIRLL